MNKESIKSIIRLILTSEVGRFFICAIILQPTVIKFISPYMTFKNDFWEIIFICTILAAVSTWVYYKLLLLVKYFE